MLHGFSDALVSGGLQISLVDGVTDYEHIVDADADEQKWQQIVNTSSLTTKVKANSRAGGKRKANG